MANNIFEFPGGGGKQIAPARLVTQAARLSTVLKDIDIAEQAASKASSTVISLYMDAGDILIAVQEEVGHGKFVAWVGANTGRTYRMASNYIRLAKGRAIIEEHLGNSVSEMSLRGALKLLQPKKTETTKLTSKPKTPVAPTITINTVVTWLATASLEDKRHIAAVLAADVQAMKKILPSKQLPAKAIDKQIFEKAMGLMAGSTTDGAPAH